ncbi:MAG: hypothetical protein SNJ57_13055 [Cyanobacteriota bacterium]
MTELLSLLQQIEAAVNSVLSQESSSQEVQHSATRLRQTIQPCFKELQRSAGVLQNLLQPCFDELSQAEAIWHSKPQIAQCSAIAIREHIGQLSGYLFKLQRSKTNLTQTVTETVKALWQKQVEAIKEKWFVNPKNSNLKTVNFSDKEKFIQTLNAELYPISIALCSSLKECFQPIVTQLQQLQLEQVNAHLNLLDNRCRSEYEPLLENLNLSSLILKLEEPYRDLLDGTQNLVDTVAPLIEKLTDQGFLTGNTAIIGIIKPLTGQGILPLTWSNFSQFSKEVDEAIEKITSQIIADRIEQIIKLLNQSIRFYDNFLEKQQRYQQETSAQRKAEQKWLAARRQDLEEMKQHTETILSYNTLNMVLS